MSIWSVFKFIGGFFIKYAKLLFNWIKATISWLKNKVKEKLRGKKNGKVFLADTTILANAVQKMAQKSNEFSLEDIDETVNSLKRLEREGHKNVMSTLDEDSNPNNDWEAVKDEDEDVRILKGSTGCATITG